MCNDGTVNEQGSSSSLCLHSISCPCLAPRHGIPYQCKGRRLAAHTLGTVSLPNLAVQQSTLGVQAMLGGPFKPNWCTNGNIWEAWQWRCHPESTACGLFSSKRDVFTGKLSNYLKSYSTTAADDFTFASKTVTADIDFCNALYMLYLQGHFYSDWQSIMALYPVFSPARAKGFLDILIPSHYYYGMPWYTRWKCRGYFIPISIEFHWQFHLDIQHFHCNFIKYFIGMSRQFHSHFNSQAEPFSLLERPQLLSGL